MADRERDLLALLSSASLVLVAGLLTSSSKLVERVVIGRLLSVEAYGEVSIGLAILSLLTTLSLVGFSQGVPRYISRFDDVRDKRGIWVSGLAVAGVVAVVAAAGLFLAADVLAEALFEEADSRTLIRVFVLALPFIVGLEVGVAALRGFENTTYKVYSKDILYQLLRLPLVAGLILAGFGVLAAGYAYLVAAVVGFVAVHLLLRRLMPLVGSFRTHTRSLFRFSAPLVISTVLSVLLTNTDTVMLGYFRTSFEVGQYSAAYPLAVGMLIVLSAFGFLYLPLASRLDADGEREEVTRIYQVTTKWIFVVTFPAFLVFTVFPGDVLRIFFGPEYAQAGPILAVLSVGFFINALAGRNRETLSALGYTDYILLANGTAFVANLGLNLVLIPQYGALGAAVASAVSLVALNLVTGTVLWRKFDITPFSGPATRTYILLPVALFPPTLALAYVVDAGLTAYTLPPFLVVAGLLGLALLSAGGGLEPEDCVVIDFVEGSVGVRVPFVRRFLPEPAPE